CCDSWWSGITDKCNGVETARANDSSVACSWDAIRDGHESNPCCANSRSLRGVVWWSDCASSDFREGHTAGRAGRTRLASGCSVSWRFGCDAHDSASPTNAENRMDFDPGCDGLRYRDDRVRTLSI